MFYRSLCLIDEARIDLDFDRCTLNCVCSAIGFQMKCEYIMLRFDKIDMCLLVLKI